MDSEAEFVPGLSVDSALDIALDLVRPLGFTSVTYDYTPVPRTHDGELITPSVLKVRNAPPDMEALWCRGGYYQCDPVQDAALAVSRTFVWSHSDEQSEVMARVLKAQHAPVVSYLRDTGMTCGVTVPIHLAGGDLATFTAIRIDPEPGFVSDALRMLPEIGDLGHLLHDAVYPGFDEKQRSCGHVKLSRRERQCMMLCAEGLTAKEIAYRIGRSVPTVTLHLNAATRKLGARNRFQAVARAAHYRLLDGAR